MATVKLPKFNRGIIVWTRKDDGEVELGFADAGYTRYHGAVNMQFNYTQPVALEINDMPATLYYWQTDRDSLRARHGNLTPDLAKTIWTRWPQWSPDQWFRTATGTAMFGMEFSPWDWI